ncbi:hypothetical protein [Streptomyces sp. NPDC006879]|uniref:hypothetical protein n=1 Tax=Streptomyces sp. NPDC006879 TaxID=3364767 RepID=UPI0036AE426B
MSVNLRMEGVVENTADVLRPARAVVVSAVCVMTTALGHALTSDDPVPWWAVGFALTATAAGSWWLTGRERGPVTVVGATVAAQGLLHLLFSLAHPPIRPSGGAAPGVEAPAGSGAGAHVHHVAGHLDPAGALHDSSPLFALAHGNSTGMLLAHLLAAVVCGLWLWRGEVAVHRTVRALAALLFAPLCRVWRVVLRTSPGQEPRTCRTLVAGRVFPQPISASLRHAVVRRGPPQEGAKVTFPSPASPGAATGT